MPYPQHTPLAGTEQVMLRDIQEYVTVQQIADLAAATTFTLAGDTGSPESIGNGDTLTIVGVSTTYAISGYRTGNAPGHPGVCDGTTDRGFSGCNYIHPSW
jgi:hypothetical protein